MPRWAESKDLNITTRGNTEVELTESTYSIKFNIQKTSLKGVG
jgi:hypothetical protein